MKKLFIYLGVIGGILLFFSCYNNKKDVTKPTADALASISFRDDIVPIMISGACGCHNNGKYANAVQFSYKDTIWYGAIQSRATVLNNMALGKDHPGEGGIYFTSSQAELVKLWVKQGAKDNYVPPPVTGPVTYTTNIVPLYKTDCKGSACHGGLGPNLDYAKMVAVKPVLVNMMNSGGVSGHPGGTLSLSSCTVKLFNEWIAQGTKQ